MYGMSKDKVHGNNHLIEEDLRIPQTGMSKVSTAERDVERATYLLDLTRVWSAKRRKSFPACCLSMVSENLILTAIL
jgi:hypothetical protein